MPHVLTSLSYAYDALEPYIDARTMEIHHSKHHAAYVNNLNAALENYKDLQTKSVEELIRSLHSLPDAVKTPVRNNGGGVLNHNMFWEILKAGTKEPSSGDLAAALTSTFGSLAAFKEQFTKAGLTRFGSGWAWLVLNKEGKLAITSSANQDSPLTDGEAPLLTCDVWEHAYYLKYQNKRADYLAAFWNIVNWDTVAARFDTATRK